MPFYTRAVVNRSYFPQTNSLDSMESKCIVINEAGKLILYLQYVLVELCIPQGSTTTIYEDNDTITIGNVQSQVHCPLYLDIRHFTFLDYS